MNAPVPTLADALAQWARTEQAFLWSDLGHELNHAQNRIWSIGAESRCMRLCSLVRIIGAIPPESVQWHLLAGGIYTTLLNIARVQVPEIDWPTLDREMGPGHGARSLHWEQRTETRKRMLAAASDIRGE